MSRNCIPFELPGFCIKTVEERHGELTIHAQVESSEAICPVCQAITNHVHSNYRRRPQDLPVSGKPVRLVLGVRRFYCRNQACSRAIFCERIPKVVAVHAQRSARLSTILGQIGLALGGRAGARHSGQMGMAASAITLFRTLFDASYASCVRS